MNVRHLDMSTEVMKCLPGQEVGKWIYWEKANGGTVRDIHLATYMQPLEKATPSGHSSPIFMVALVEM